MPTKPRKKLDSKFRGISNFTSKIVGSPEWFVFSVMVVIIWFPSRRFFDSDELWHLFINTFTTILTFLMISLLHSSQNLWEKKIEQLHEKNERILKLLEKDTEEIKTSLNPQGNGTENEKKNEENNKENNKLSSGSTTITSLL